MKVKVTQSLVKFQKRYIFLETPRKYIAATIVLCLSSFFVLKIGSFLFEQQTQHSIDFIGHYFGTGTNRKGKANVFSLSGWVRYCYLVGQVYLDTLVQRSQSLMMLSVKTIFEAFTQHSTQSNQNVVWFWKPP